MTELEWLRSIRTEPMWTHTIGKGNRRHLLFDAACCRRLWSLLVDQRSKTAIDILELYADDEGTYFERLMSANEDAASVCDLPLPAQNWNAAWAAYWATLVPRDDPNLVASEAIKAVVGLEHEESAAQADVLRDIFGNPFKPYVITQNWRSWNHGTIEKLATNIYDSRDYSLVPSLTECLKKAGCSDELYQHLTLKNTHVRGCWVIDLLRN